MNLPAFEAYVKEAGVEGIMGAYNRLNGDLTVTWCQTAERLLKNDTLKVVKKTGNGYYQKLMNILKADMVIHKETETVQERCVEKIQNICSVLSERWRWNIM